MVERIGYISYLISQDKFTEALERFEELENEYPRNKVIQFNKLGFLVDIGYGLRRQELVRNALEAGEELLKVGQYEKYKTDIHYNMANGYLSLYNLSERATGIRAIPQSENLQNAKKHFREATQTGGRYNPNLSKQIWVNFGNCLDALVTKSVDR